MTVNGVSEVWQLQWKTPPTPECGVLDEIAFTCPCNGFGYGETGQLDLVRIRNGKEYERLALSPFFHGLGSGKATVQKWAPGPGDAHDVSVHYNDDEWRTKSLRRFRTRPLVKLIKLDDYNGDGQKTEFFLQTDSLGCGKPAGIVAGITRSDDHLHAFKSLKTSPPNTVLPYRDWEMLRKSPAAAAKQVE